MESTTKSNTGLNMEKWNIHLKAEPVSKVLIDLWPLIKHLHKEYPKDIIYVDFSRVHHFYDPVEKTIKASRVNNQDPFWTKENPFPLNCISNDAEVLSIWDLKKGVTKSFKHQKYWEVQAMIAMKNGNPEKTVIIVGEYIHGIQKGEETVELPFITCYMVKHIKIKPTAEEPIEDQLVLTVEPTVVNDF